MTEKFSDEWWDEYWKDEPVLTIRSGLSFAEARLHKLRQSMIRDIKEEYKDVDHWTEGAKVNMINAGYESEVAELRAWYAIRIENWEAQQAEGKDNG